MQLGATIPTDILMEVCLALVSGTVVMERSLESAVASQEVYLVLVLVTEVSCGFGNGAADGSGDNDR